MCLIFSDFYLFPKNDTISLNMHLFPSSPKNIHLVLLPCCRQLELGTGDVKEMACPRNDASVSRYCRKSPFPGEGEELVSSASSVRL